LRSLTSSFSFAVTGRLTLSDLGCAAWVCHCGGWRRHRCHSFGAAVLHVAQQVDQRAPQRGRVVPLGPRLAHLGQPRGDAVGDRIAGRGVPVPGTETRL
jgi:hypothetical protein